MSNMLFELTEQGVLIIAHSSATPSNDEWGGYVTLCREKKDAIRGFIVFTQGGAPNAIQRSTIADVWLAHPELLPPTAVVTVSPIVRGIVTALSWVGANNMRAFAPGDVSKALNHINALPTHKTEIIFRANRFLNQMGCAMTGIA